MAKKAYKRPQRQKKSDRLLHTQRKAAAVQVDYAVAPFTRAMAEADRRWGVDRLVELVSPSTAAKFGKALAGLNEAIDKEEPEAAVTWAGSCIRGLAIMDQEATAAGAQPASQDIWEVDIDGTVYGIMRDGCAWEQIKADRPDLELVTLREVALAVCYYRNTVAYEMEQQVKKHFPSAEVTAIKVRRSGDVPDDKIPF